MILQALLEGGWSEEKEESPEPEKDDPDFEPSENTLVNSILSGSADNASGSEQQMVQSALSSQTVSSPGQQIKYYYDCAISIDSN